MKVIIRSKTLEVTKALNAFIRKQARKLTKSGQRIEKITVFLEAVRPKNDEKSSTVKFFVDLPGKNLVVQRQAEDMYKAIVDTADRASRYLRKKKEKRLTKKRQVNNFPQVQLAPDFNPQL